MTHDQAVRTMASERYLLDEMSELERYQFEAHYFDCLDCAEDVRLGAAISAEVKAGSHLAAGDAAGAAARPVAAGASPQRTAGTAGPSAAAPPAPAWRRASVVLPWAAAAVLAVTVGYQAAAVPDSAAVEPQAVSPVMLRGVSRGADPVVTISPDQALVAVTVDVLAEPGTRELAFELLSPASSAVISGRAPLPAAGAPLLLLVPADRLTGPGAYSLVVRDADRPGMVLGEYRFIAQY